MSRRYDIRRIKTHRVYSGSDIQWLLGVSANTISNWVTNGLKPSDKRKPYVFRGEALKQFLVLRQSRSKQNLRPGEFKCIGCKSAVFPDRSAVVVRHFEGGRQMLESRCPDCDAHVWKIPSRPDLEATVKRGSPNTTPECPREVDSSFPGRVGKCCGENDRVWWPSNDRIVYEWQHYAGRYDPKTVDQHLAAIRMCDQLCGGLSFSKYTRGTAAKVRDHLKASLTAKVEIRKSKSTVAHTASHLTHFFSWLLSQDGFKHLPSDLPEYFTLPKSAYSAALSKRSKSYVSVEEAKRLLDLMPSKTLLEQRARAIFAIAYLGALRADTLISLRICHFDKANKLIVQDASIVRTKGGKSLRICWFPIPDAFSEAVIEWVERLEDLGFEPDDALFPSSVALAKIKITRSRSHKQIEPMATTQAVTDAFANACANGDTKITPHSAKDTIAAERDSRPLTQLQRKAWADNMGHENEQTTERYYGKLPEADRIKLIEKIDLAGSGVTPEWSDAQKIALVDSVLNEMRRF